MEKKELEDIYNEFLDYANNKAEQSEFQNLLLIELSLKAKLKHFDEYKNDTKWQQTLEEDKQSLIRRGYINHGNN